MSTKVWNLMWPAGITGMKQGSVDNPLSREDAMAAARALAGCRWRVWVENSVTGEIIFESDDEKEAKAAR